MAQIRCDKPMRRSKERAAAKRLDVRQWRCTDDCANCICGMVKQHDGLWSHVNPLSKRRY